MQIRLEAEEGQCKVDPISKNEDDKKYRQQLSEKNKLQKTNVFQGIVGRDGHQSELDVVLGGQLQRKEHHQRLRICWERILPQRCLRVLLVEDDDSTRQVVIALLLHCGYEVTAVVNDLEAWELLEDPSNHFNLILAEVMIPCLSGIGLLRKIMSHQIYRNIPVIMMSSRDSMSVIFKCLTMGAVDFLIKPVRKNELKNIWKHIWKRRQNRTSSISACGSGRYNQDKKSAGLEKASGSGNKTYSNEESNNVVGVRKSQKGTKLDGRIDAGISCTGKIEGADSDKGRGTQAGNEDLEQGDVCEPDCNHNNTSSFNTIKPNKDQFKKEFVCLVEISGDCTDRKIEDCEMRKDVEFSFPRETLADPQHFRDKMVCDQICDKKKDEPSQDHLDIQKENTNLTTFGSEYSEPCREAIDLIGSIARKNEGRNAEEETRRTKEENDFHGRDETISDSNFTPLLELTLKRPVSASEGSLPENCHVLKPSVVSAFSRYNTKCSHIEHPSSGSFPLNTHSLLKDYKHTHSSSIPGTQQTMSSHHVLPFEGMNSSKRDAIDVSIPSAKQLQILCRSNNQEDTDNTTGFSGQHSIPFMLPIKDEMMPALYAPSHMEMLMPVPIVYSAIPAYYGPAFHAMIYSRPGAPSEFPTKSNGTQRPDDYNISFCNEKQAMPSETPQPSQHGNHHYHYHIEHHHHCCNSHKNHCLHQHANQDELSLNNSAMVGAPINGYYSMVDNNNTLDGHHGGMGSSGTGSVNKTSPMAKTQTNGQNECYQNYDHALQYESQEHQHPKVDKQIMNESRITALVCSSCNNVQSGSSNGNEIINAIDPRKSNRIDEKTDHDNGQSSATVNPVTNGECGVINGVTDGSGVDQNRSVQREAALTKFRLKRKERCFEKKVRYQSRKKLAEQRPRVKGQFVRHLIQESATGNVD